MTEREALASCLCCGADCVVQEFSGDHIAGVARVWMCSNSRVLRGTCSWQQGALSAEAWNEFHRRRSPAPVAAREGMVRRLLDDLEALEPHLLEQVRYSEPGLKMRAMLSAAPAQSPVSEGAEIERLRAEAGRLAYGLLWHMEIDTNDPDLRLASDARKALLTTLSKVEQADGIARAKASGARFTGAA